MGARPPSLGGDKVTTGLTLVHFFFCAVVGYVV